MSSTNNDNRESNDGHTPISFPATTATATATTTTANHNAAVAFRHHKQKFRNVAEMVMAMNRRSSTFSATSLPPLLEEQDNEVDVTMQESLRSNASSRHPPQNPMNDYNTGSETTPSSTGGLHATTCSTDSNHRRLYSTSTVPTFSQPHHHHQNHFELARTVRGHPSTIPHFMTSTPMPMFSSTADNNATSHLMDHAQHLENLFRQTSHEPHSGDATTLDFDNLPTAQQELVQWQRGRIVGFYETPPPPPGNSTTTTTTSRRTGDDVEQGRSYCAGNSDDFDFAHDTTPLIPTTSSSSQQPQPRQPSMASTFQQQQSLLAAKQQQQQQQQQRRYWTNCMAVLQPRQMAAAIRHFITGTFVFVIVPSLVAAAILFYPLDNPDLQFLPSSARLPWFCLFIARQTCTLTLAQLSQWCILDILTIRTTIFVSCCGPFLTLVAMQSQGWPFVVSAWGCWNLVLLHGDSDFVKHWLWFTRIRLFSITYNTGDGILSSDLYGRILAAMIVVGAITAAKRTFVALYLSRRMLQYYRRQLELVMSQIHLVMQVAELAQQTEQPGFQELLDTMMVDTITTTTTTNTTSKITTSTRNSRKDTANTAAPPSLSFSSSTTRGQEKQPQFQRSQQIASSLNAAGAKNKFVETVPTFKPTTEKKKKTAGSSKKSSSFEECGADDEINLDDYDDEDHNDDDDNENDDDADAHPMSEAAAASSTASSSIEEDDPVQQALDESEAVDITVQWEAMKQRAMNDRHTMNFGNSSDETVHSQKAQEGQETEGRAKGHRRGNGRLSSSTGINGIFPFLERWQEPEDKARKAVSPTLHDILQFKKAMAFMDTDFPFSPAFGSADNRKACVRNAVKVYRRLLRFTPDQPILSFDVIGALAYNEDGELDEDRAIALLRVFYPDNEDMLPMLAFVQSIDGVYKKLRFLRASLNNSSKIDSVLEDNFNLIFDCVLVLLILSLCGFDPWPLLASFSALTISFAFAFGNSVAKNVEGILLIAVRRPYDIGDRITITGAEQVANPTAADTWLVEDISLTTTTLRFAATNECATINNASVANSRIANLARSPKASVTIRIKLDVDASQRQLDEFRVRMESYLEDRPRSWVGLIQHRSELIDTDSGFVVMMYRAQHTKSWQELGDIMKHRGEWERHAVNVATEMEIVFDCPPRQLTVGVGLARESDKDKAVDDRKRVAEFIRTINSMSRESGSPSELEKSGTPSAISEYFGAMETTTADPTTTRTASARNSGTTD